MREVNFAGSSWCKVARFLDFVELDACCLLFSPAACLLWKYRVALKLAVYEFWSRANANALG
jgi:hypothetical protein